MIFHQPSVWFLFLLVLVPFGAWLLFSRRRSPAVRFSSTAVAVAVGAGVGVGTPGASVAVGVGTAVGVFVGCGVAVGSLPQAASARTAIASSTKTRDPRTNAILVSFISGACWLGNAQHGKDYGNVM